jgi:hypothetical protein
LFLVEAPDAKMNSGTLDGRRKSRQGIRREREVLFELERLSSLFGRKEGE